MKAKNTNTLLLCSIKVGRYYLPIFSAPSRKTALEYFRAVCVNFTRADGNKVTLCLLGTMNVKTGKIIPVSKVDNMEVYYVR